MNKKVRVRFAPSPTGGLHIGGVRTVLYNYLFAKNNKGDFIVRIEDTDQSRYVPGAEQYIFNCLNWVGLRPDESPVHGGNFGPYRQSERKEIYRQYAEQLVNDGHAYYAFDTPEELEKMRHEFKTDDNPSPQYDKKVRLKMNNSVALSSEETEELLNTRARYVIRIKIPEAEKVSFIDMIRGEVNFDTTVLDDKVLLKADGMPTYHLAVVVDDYLMKITHAFRGEEWLPSAPVHILLWKYLFGLENMPQWAHLPLILGHNGKLSKRDGANYGFPVFAMNWTDPKTNELTEGFKEKGFLPEAFINLLALLGWNDGTEQEIFTIEELISRFSIDRVHNGGAKFDYEKAKWFNHEWIKKSGSLDWYQPISQPLLTQQRNRALSGMSTVDVPLHEKSGFEIIPNLLSEVKKILKEKGVFKEDISKIFDDDFIVKIIRLVKDRCTLLTDFVEQTSFFFHSPATIDTAAIQPKWDDKKNLFFIELIRVYELASLWQHDELETAFKELAAANKLKPGELMLPFRIMLVGAKFGPGVFEIADILGKNETISRIKKTLSLL